MPQLKREDAFNDLKKLNGNPPFDGGSNMVRDDGIFANSLITKYRMSLTELEEWSGYRQAKENANAARTAYETAWEYNDAQD